MTKKIEDIDRDILQYTHAIERIQKRMKEDMSKLKSLNKGIQDLVAERKQLLEKGAQ
jgi:peptidoglycan hydrolase CwlO-like protein